MVRTSAHPSIVVSGAQSAQRSGVAWRARADVNGEELWLEADAPLAPVGDAWASMLLMAAARDGATLRVEADLDRRLHDNFRRIDEVARSWWGFPGAAGVEAARLVDRAPSGGAALYFTCGVDSFYSLRKHRHAIERLIFVRGLNVNLVDPADQSAWERARAGVANVAAELAIPVVFADTNLRRHPTFTRVGWDVSHVGALAGIAHALAPGVSRVFLGSSDLPAPYGSRPELDPLWSSGAVEIVNDGWELLKPGKVRAIADWTAVHRHLRVCYRPGSGALNCGACAKCVRTQLLFEIAGTRERLETFPRTPIAGQIDGLPWIDRDAHFLWEQLVPEIRDPAIVAAIARLLARRPPPLERLRGRAHRLRQSAPGRMLRRFVRRLLPARVANGGPVDAPALQRQGPRAKTT